MTKLDKLISLRQGWDHDGMALEIAGECAATLGQQGQKAAKALERLSDLPPEDDAYQTQLDRAAYAVWAYFIQRELIGLRNHADIIAELNIPTQVLNRMGKAAAATPV